MNLSILLVIQPVQFAPLLSLPHTLAILLVVGDPAGNEPYHQLNCTIWTQLSPESNLSGDTVLYHPPYATFNLFRAQTQFYPFIATTDHGHHSRV